MFKSEAWYSGPISSRLRLCKASRMALSVQYKADLQKENHLQEAVKSGCRLGSASY